MNVNSMSVWMAAGAALVAAESHALVYTNPPLQRGPSDPLLPAIAILQAEKPPVVDGVLDDPCWSKAEESQVFADEYSFPVDVKTTFRICQKDEVLYLAIRGCYDEKGGKKTGDGGTHDGAVWNGENVEIFFDPDNEDTPGYYQFILTPFDVTADLYNNEPRDPELRWEPKYQVKSKWSEKEWTIEYGIPLNIFSFTKTVYENFGLNVHRVCPGAPRWSVGAWSPGHTEGFHFPHKFGEARGLKGAGVTSNAPGRFRSPYMKVNDRVIKAKANPSLIPEKPPALASGPEVKASGSSAEIGFEVNTKTDVAVWIEDGRGERVRHLVAGMLGSNAPAPLKKNSLKQSVAWDYLDDFGKKVPAGAYKAKVGVGSKAALDKEIGRFDGPRQVNGLTVDDKGFIYTYEGYLDQWSRIMKFDRNGKFVSMLMPPPADVPVEKLKALNIIDFGPDGRVTFGSNRMGDSMPHLDLPFPQTPLVNSKGQVIFSGCEYQGGPAHFYKINADGSLPEDCIGPYIKDMNWLNFFESEAKRFHYALDPLDEDVIYLSGLKEIHRSTKAQSGMNEEVIPGNRETFYNAVCRVRWGQDAPLATFVGKRNTHGTQGGSAPGEFFDPQGIAFDKENNLWVCDRRNNRLQVFDHSGKFLKQIPHHEPYQIRISRKTGRRYVLGIPPTNTLPPNMTLADFNWPSNKIPPRFLTFGTLTLYDAGDSPRVLAQTNVPGGWNYWWDMALDESGSRPELVLLWTGRHVLEMHGAGNSSGFAHSILRIADLGDRFSEPQVFFDKEPPKPYYRIAVGWESDMLCAGTSNHRQWFDANSGRDLGPLDDDGKEIVAARDGRWLVRHRFDNQCVKVMPEAWATNASLPPLTNWSIVPPSLTRGGERGFCVAPNSDVYVARYYNWTGCGSGRTGLEGPDHHVGIDRYTIDGKQVGPRLVYELSGGAHSPVVDIKGNIYVADNFLRKLGQFYEDDIAANMPSWAPDYHVSEADWDTLRSGKMLHAGYRKFVVNPLLKSVGTIYKFGPRGGGLLWRAAMGPYEVVLPHTNAQGQFMNPDWHYPPTPAPKRPATHWSSAFVMPDGREGMYPAWVDGVEWEFPGSCHSPGRFSKGHDACICPNMRFCADDFGRTYVPAAHRSTIRMIDTAGNEVLRIGSYGNLDSGPGGRLKEPNIPLRYPSGATLSKRYLYVTEMDTVRILRIKMGYEQERAAEVAVR